MIEIPAYYFDGKSSERREVSITFFPPGSIHISGLGDEQIYSLSEIKISPRIGNAPRALYLPGEAKCEIADNDAVDEILRRSETRGFQDFVHGLESKLVYAVAALIFTAIVMWGFVEYGLPELARRAAFTLPPSVNASLGSEGLELMDKMFFEPSELTEDEKGRVAGDFSIITRDLSEQKNFRLEFRKSELMGANAFALPSGIIVLTDALVEMAGEKEELISVMAHEVGHVEERHSLRMLLQASAVALIVSSITGDITSITALSSTLPTLLLEAKFSKEFEAEADAYAYDYLKGASIPTIHFANILEKMTAARGESGKGHGYLSSHPATDERIKRFKE